MREPLNLRVPASFRCGGKGRGLDSRWFLNFRRRKRRTLEENSYCKILMGSKIRTLSAAADEECGTQELKII
jgi:hypothetical protein